MALTLPDTANLGDTGHISDHNLIVAALSSLDASKAPSANPTFTGTVALPSTTTLNGVTLTAGGLTYITKADFTASSAVIVNSCFTSTYDTYLVLLSPVVGSADADLSIRLRASGVDAATNYNWQSLLASASTVSGSRTSAATSARIGTAYTTGPNMYAITMYGPALSAATSWRITGTYLGGPPTVADHAGNHTTASPYDGFDITPGSGTITGSVYIYGYRKA